IILLLAIHILLSLSIASLRNGVHSVAEPYIRTEYEYIGDIGITSNIYQLLNNYHELQSKLSLHAKLAPPGPLIILWALSYILGRTPLTLAIATIILGSTALISLYLWAKEISQKFSVNPVQISILYAVMPGIILFTSTSSEILYMPFLFITLFFFERALNNKSLILISLGGFSFAILSFLKFTLLSTAIYFFLSGIFSIFSRKQKFSSLILYGVIMSASFIGFYIALYFLTGYQPVKVFLQAHTLFLQDIEAIKKLSPRYSIGWFKIFNTWSWLYFSGIPIAMGFFITLANTESYKKSSFWEIFLTFLILNLAYIAPGEGERSALYIYPFILLISTQAWNKEFSASPSILTNIVTFQIFQSVLTESLFYTYW
ncbi:MAG: hypothetical protein N3G21_07275, partial [Candidatus Hydrogenedentes bacterium]|nr:hypothetical protein [Candidatus Hydrogenedentota bacterium]